MLQCSLVSFYIIVNNVITSFLVFFAIISDSRTDVAKKCSRLRLLSYPYWLCLQECLCEREGGLVFGEKNHSRSQKYHQYLWISLLRAKLMLPTFLFTSEPHKLSISFYVGWAFKSSSYLQIEKKRTKLIKLD